MPKYRYECGSCGRQFLRFKRFENLNQPEQCPTCPVVMKRLFTASFQIIAHREQDKRENKLYDILTKGGTEADKLALYKQDMARQEATMNAMPDVAKEFTTEDILNTGICEAARSGDVGIANWRKEHIPVKTYKQGEAITA